MCAVVLCRVMHPGNVGAICRAMKTMGATRLILANCPEYDEGQVTTMAVHAIDIYKQALRVPTLAEALAPFAISAGFSRRTGSRRSLVVQSLAAFADMVAGMPVSAHADGGAGNVDRQGPLPQVALVFGNESDGLSDEEVSLCTEVVYIPSSELYPSLNVSHAVQVACYALRERLLCHDPTPMLAHQNPSREVLHQQVPVSGKSMVPAPRAHVDEQVSAILDAFRKLGFFTRSDDSHARRMWRSLFERAGVTEEELSYFTKVLLKACALAGGRGMPRKKGSVPPP
ncbi:MAG: RNA methyltransferase [Spirochaetales bacterium]|nr:RNA methyltransferase [Spirochaetales bacterium]